MSWKKGIAVFKYLRNNEILPAVLAIIVWFIAVPGSAGDHHTVGTSSLVCSDCHTIHYTQLGTRYEAGGPWPRLLLYSVINGLCLSCHDGQSSVPDVMLGQAGSYTRAAGAFQASSGSSTPNGHNLGVSGTPPGGTDSMTLTCTSCHDPHGNAYYRNLKTTVGGISNLFVSYVNGTNDLTNASVFQPQTTPMATHYNASNIKYNQPASKPSEYANWCKGCHTNFHGSTETGSPEPWIRHPTSLASMSISSTKVNWDHWNTGITGSRVPVMSASQQVPNQDNTPSCMTCHKVHGSVDKNGIGVKYSLILDDETTATLEDGDSATLAGKIGTCQQCHYQ